MIFRRLNIYHTDYDRLVACVVAYFKLNAMRSVCDFDLINRDNTVCVSCINFNAVNICLGAFRINSGRMSITSDLFYLSDHL